MKMELINLTYDPSDKAKVPPGWEAKSLQDICVQKGLIRGPFGGALKKESFVRTGYKVYEQKNAIYQDAQLGDYFIDAQKYEELKRFAVGAGDFIVSCSGTIGRIFRIPEGSPMGIINQALLLIKTDDQIIDSDYFYQYFQWESFQRRIIDNTQGGAMANLVAMNIFKKTTIDVPPLEEQRRIAEILLTWDKVIKLKQTLIEQIGLQKIGLMQNLLTGKIRLSSAKGEWKEVELRHVGSFLKGKGISKDQVVENGFGCVLYGEIYTRHHVFIRKFYSFINDEDATGSTQIRKNDILFAGSGETAEEIGKCVAYLGDESAYAGGDIIILRPEVKVDSLFLSYALNTGKAAIQRAKLGQGHSVVHIYPSTLAEIKVPLPDYDEQCEIAKLLRVYDECIDLLEEELTALKQQKSGLMQLLLTGKVRVQV
ncbi:restriction endonuclease subunit S [Alicyclobacillus tolerans]|uniref:Restriction endonuclease S subunit n=1 Tax=Alicyclobacillus tolerans TaxID=90970 RepID=A0A1M6TQ48_9BACL|nr:restriction endonuclease subunit S [Alicyclobacillus montanus]SHK59056.1 Restriction endonuclease S subunit [Alicyclobacillus montanus]